MAALFPYRIVALAASAGGLAALSTVLSRLPADFPSPILIVQHLDPHRRSWLAEILGRASPLAVHQALDGEALCPGTVYIAPPGRHLLVVRPGRIALSDSPPLHFVRPAADVLFSSLAACCGRRTIAVVLTGTGHDGSGGAVKIKEAGGTVFAQSEKSSEFFGMPSAAINSGAVDRVLALEDIAAILVGQAPVEATRDDA
jgi:two-component system chemotaxis response regulator CheB